MLVRQEAQTRLSAKFTRLLVAQQANQLIGMGAQPVRDFVENMKAQLAELTRSEAKEMVADVVNTFNGIKP